MANAELIAKIKAEIDKLYGEYKDKFHQSGDQYHLGLIDGLDMAERVLDTLESGKPMNPDDAMKELDEKIALVKQRGTWDGVDVDKYMDEVRGREPEKPVPADLEEAAEKHLDTVFGKGKHQPFYKVLFVAGGIWQKEQDDKELSDLLTIAHLQGAEQMKEQMMKEAVKWLVDDDYDELTDKGRFILGSAGLGYNGYYIPYSDLLKLPKED